MEVGRTEKVGESQPLLSIYPVPGMGERSSGTAHGLRDPPGVEGRRCSCGTEKVLFLWQGPSDQEGYSKGQPFPLSNFHLSLSPEAIRCPRPQNFENGEYWPRAPYYNLSDEISFHCYDGYTLRGSANRSCQVTGRWDGQTAICDNGGEKHRLPPRW